MRCPQRVGKFTAAWPPEIPRRVQLWAPRDLLPALCASGDWLAVLPNAIAEPGITDRSCPIEHSQLLERHQIHGLVRGCTDRNGGSPGRSQLVDRLSASANCEIALEHQGTHVGGITVIRRGWRD